MICASNRGAFYFKGKCEGGDRKQVNNSDPRKEKEAVSVCYPCPPSPLPPTERARQRGLPLTADSRMVQILGEISAVTLES
jgi:hypothetical protein